MIFVLLTAGLVIAGWFYYRKSVQHYRAEVERQLSAIADLKVDELTQWRKERLADGSILFRNAAISALVRRFLEKPEDADAQRQLQVWLGKYQVHYQYDEVRLLDTQGVCRLSLTAGLPTDSSPVAKGVSNALQSGQVTFQDFYRSEWDRQVHLGVLVPILDEQDANRPLGVLFLRIDPTTYLYPFIQRWPTSSKTAETLLVRREGNDVVFLNELRFETNTALNLCAPLDRIALPAVQAALGREGIMDGVDYRGAPVLAAVRTILDSPWALVARIDNEEVFALQRRQLWQMIAVVTLVLFGVGVSMFLVWRQQLVWFYKERAEIGDRIRASEIRYRRLFEAARDGVLVLDAETGMVEDVNPCLIELLGVTREVFLGKKVWELGFFKDLIANEANFAELKEKKYIRYEDMTLEGHDGKRHEVEFVSNVYLVNDQKVIQCNIRDISERVRAKEQLQQQAKKLQASNEDLSRLNRLMTGRELRVIELKQQVNDLAAQLGQPRPHPLAFMDAAAAEVLRTTPKPGEPEAEVRGQRSEVGDQKSEVSETPKETSP